MVQKKKQLSQQNSVWNVSKSISIPETISFWLSDSQKIKQNQCSWVWQLSHVFDKWITSSELEQEAKVCNAHFLTSSGNILICRSPSTAINYHFCHRLHYIRPLRQKRWRLHTHALTYTQWWCGWGHTLDRCLQTQAELCRNPTRGSSRYGNSREQGKKNKTGGWESCPPLEGDGNAWRGQLHWH